MRSGAAARTARRSARWRDRTASASGALRRAGEGRPAPASRCTARTHRPRQPGPRPRCRLRPGCRNSSTRPARVARRSRASPVGSATSARRCLPEHDAPAQRWRPSRRPRPAARAVPAGSREATRRESAGWHRCRNTAAARPSTAAPAATDSAGCATWCAARPATRPAARAGCAASRGRAGARRPRHRRAGTRRARPHRAAEKAAWWAVRLAQSSGPRALHGSWRARDAFGQLPQSQSVRAGQRIHRTAADRDLEIDVAGACWRRVGAGGWRGAGRLCGAHRRGSEA